MESLHLHLGQIEVNVGKRSIHRTFGYVYCLTVSEMKISHMLQRLVVA